MGIVKSTPFQMKKSQQSDNSGDALGIRIEDMIMFITKKHLSRRTFLQGAGATLALPFLESMIPAMTAQAATNSGTRLGFVYVPHGAIMDRWTPKTEGAGFRIHSDP